MRNLILTSMAVLILGSLANAQEAPAFRHGLGHFVLGPTVITDGSDAKSAWQAAVGGEYRFANGLGIGAEIGGLDELAQISFNPYFHFNTLDRRGKLVPFVTAGFTGAGNMEFGENWLNFGGGVDYWIKNRVGARFEVRDMVDTNHSRPNHFVGFRMGLVWR